MKPSLIPARLLAEILAIVAVVQAGLGFALPRLWPGHSGLSGVAATAFGATLLVLVSAPTVYWRCMSAVRRAGVPREAKVAADAGSLSRSSRRGTAVAMTAAAQVSGLLLTAAAVSWVMSNIDDEARVGFERQTERIEAEILRRFQLPVYGMKGARGVYAANRLITRAQFRAYVESRNLPLEFPGVHGFGFIQHVMRDDLDSFVATERADDATDFELKVSGDPPDRYIVKFVEPSAQNHEARGVDLGAEPVGRAAIERAVDTGQPALTGKLNLLESKERGPGFLYLVPVYRYGTDPVTAAQRRHVLVGLVFVSIYATDLLADVADVADRALGFELMLGDGGHAGQTVFSSVPASGSERHASRRLLVGGNELTLHTRSTAAFEAQHARHLPAYVGLGGALLSFLLALAVWSLASGSVRAHTLARRMTASLEKTAAELARERQRLENILHGTRVGTWEFNVRTGESQVNARWSEMLGYTPDELGPVTDKTWAAHAHPEDLQRSKAALRQHFDGETEHYEAEIRLRHKQGHWIWVLSRGSLFQRDAQGRPELMAGTHLDVTARKRAEEALRHTNEVLQAVLDNLPCGLSVFDGDLVLQAHNQKFRTLLDLPDSLFAAATTRFDSIIRHNTLHGEYGTGDVDTLVAQIVERARRPAPHRFERLRPDGRTLDIHGAPMPHGGFVTTYTDISERKRAEAIVRDREHLVRLVTDHILGRIAYWDRDLRLRFANKAFFARYGGSPAECIGREAGAIFGEVRSAASAEMTAAALRGLPQSFEHEELSADGEVTQSLVQMIPDWRDETVHGFVSMTVDISFVKRAESELRSANQALAFERDRAEQASQAKGQFLANMSHEIRTPMNAILGMLKLLCGTPLTSRQFDYAHKTERAARALLGLLNDILDFSKIEAGKMALDPRPFALDELLRDLSVILSSNLGDKPVEVLFDVDAALPRRLVGDDMRLQQVLVNLAGNAIKFTAEGEVVVQVSLLEYAAGACRVRFAVRDTGIGMTPQQQQHVFGSFAQAEASTTRRFGGTGLGLSICQRLVGLMGSRIEVDSAPGAGSTFRFDLALPMAEQPAAPPEHEPLRALVVDDNHTARLALAAMTASLGWPTDVAASGEEAIHLLERQLACGEPYQAVFVDWQMPGLDGWQTSARLRALAQPSCMPLLLMVTAHGREKLAQRSAEDQALLDGFLVKPVTALMLQEAVVEARRGGADVVVAAPSTRLLGLRLLVVEDNANNQQVALELLQGEGAHVSIAGDGAQGVAAVAVADPPFDAVLMDVQMPVMDGYTATTQIRNRLGLATLPIIAMTANAMSSDRDASLAAGMNDHVGKPFDLDELVATLLRHTGRVSSPAASRPGHSALPTLPVELLHQAGLHGIDLRGAVSRLGGRLDVWARTARSFAGQLADMNDELAGLLDQGAWAKASGLMHTLKGVAAMLGAAELTALASDAEQSLQRAPSIEALADLRARAAAAMTSTGRDFEALLQLQEGLAPAAPAAPGARDPQGLLRDLAALVSLLDAADMAATDSFATLQQTHETHWDAELRALSDAVSALDFERALRECRMLTQQLVAA